MQDADGSGRRQGQTSGGRPDAHGFRLPPAPAVCLILVPLWLTARFMIRKDGRTQEPARLVPRTALMNSDTGAGLRRDEPDVDTPLHAPIKCPLRTRGKRFLP